MESNEAPELNHLAGPLGDVLERMGVQRNTVGFHRLMTSAIDLNDVNPDLMRRFVDRIPELVKGGLTLEEISKARADSYQDPESRVWQFNREVFKSYSDLLAHERLAATAYDYGGRL